MPNLLAFDPAQFVGFVLIFARIMGVFMSAPVLGNNNVPTQINIAFAFITSLVFFPLVRLPQLGASPDILEVLVLMTGETAVGVMMGFSARLLFVAVSLAGEVVGFQMGLAIANVFDPGAQQQVSLLGQIQLVFATLLFVVMDGHHLFIRGLAASYRYVQPGGFVMGQAQVDHLVSLSASLFVLGLRIGAPLVVAMMAANFSIGLVARVVPQVNVFIVGLPFTLMLGILLLGLSFPFFIEAAAALHGEVQRMLLNGLLSHG